MSLAISHVYLLKEQLAFFKAFLRQLSFWGFAPGTLRGAYITMPHTVPHGSQLCWEYVLLVHKSITCLLLFPIFLKCYLPKISGYYMLIVRWWWSFIIITMNIIYHLEISIIFHVQSEGTNDYDKTVYYDRISEWCYIYI